MNEHNRPNENRLLAHLASITFLGDFISIFAIILILENFGIAPEYNGLNFIYQALAYSLSAMTFPFLSSRLNTKLILIISQILSSLTSIFVLISYLNNSIQLATFLLCTFTVTFCYQSFDSAKNQHSKLIGSSNEHHQKNEVQLLKYYFGAQTIGPLISLFLISKFPLWVPLVIDSITFIACAILALKLQLLSPIKTASIFKPFKYIWRLKNVRDITLLRSIGFWYGAGIFDYLMVPFLHHKYGPGVSYLAWIFSSLGFGGVVGISLVRHPIEEKRWLLGRYPLWKLAIGANIGMALTMMLFWLPDSFVICSLISIVHGIFMGILAGASQIIRKQVTTNEQFPEIVSMEIMLGRLTATAVPLIIFSYLTKLNYSYQSFQFLPAISSICLAFFYFFCFRNETSSNIT